MEEKNGKSGSTHSAHGVESSEASFWPNMKGERRRKKPIAIIDRA
jgi:ribosomal protein S6E (S10)